MFVRYVDFWPEFISLIGVFMTCAHDSRVVVNAGGGIFNWVGTLTITNSTLSGNWANSDNGTIGQADLDRQNVNLNFVTGGSGSFGIALYSE